jgi:hypothetical protein
MLLFSARIKDRRLLFFLLSFGALLCSPVLASAADMGLAFVAWFAPNSDSPDFLELFRKPDAWSISRSLIKVVKFGPRQLTSDVTNIHNSFRELVEVDAFRKLENWGISVAVEAPSVKEWDCTGQRAAKVSLQYLQNVHSAGADVKYVAMDEPLVSGLRSCKLSVEEVAERTAFYTEYLTSNSKYVAPNVVFGDIEPYPSFSVNQLKSWSDALSARGVMLGFFHLDVDLADVSSRRSTDFAADLRALRAFFESKKIPFGIIFWSGRDPEGSDESYYNHVISFVKAVRSSIGVPPQLIFQSWVLRVSMSCKVGVRCNATETRCSPSDPPYCGSRSIPINLPESSVEVFSHTRLINESIRILKTGGD